VYKENTADGVATSVLAGLGWLFDSFVINIYALALPFIALSFHAKPLALGFVASLFLFGYTIGTIGFGILTDYLGRKRTLSLSIAGYAVITALTALSSSIAILGAMRFLTGIGGGGELPVGATFTAEMWPAKRRGWGIALMYIGYPLGYLLAVGLTALVIHPVGWRGVFGIALIPGILIWAVRKLLKESPRFEAIQQRLVVAREARQHVGAREVFKTRESRRHLLMGILIYIPLAYCYYALSVFLPTYMKTVLHLSYGRVLTDLTWLTLSYVVLVMLIGWFSDLVGRRPLAVICALVAGIGGILMFSTSSPATFMAIGLVAYPAWVGLTWTLGITYVSEIFPTATRGSGFGLSVGFGRITSIFAPLISGALATTMGLAGAFKIAALVWILYVIGFSVGRETKGLTLEQIEEREIRGLHDTAIEKHAEPGS
jgi:putative MFS transporter